jgi:hypothetical protein
LDVGSALAERAIEKLIETINIVTELKNALLVHKGGPIEDLEGHRLREPDRAVVRGLEVGGHAVGVPAFVT